MKRGAPRGVPHKMLTKSEIRLIRDMWETHSLTDIADRLGVRKGLVSIIAQKMRKLGLPLPKKTQKGYLHGLIQDVLDEY